MEKYKVQSIDRLDISDNAINLLKQNNIETLGELCNKTKQELKQMQLMTDENMIYKLGQNELDKIDEQLRWIGLYLPM